MTNGFEEARRGRNWLERLGEKIPGFRGFQDLSLRRDVDKLQREHLARRVSRLKVAVRGKARAYTDAGQIGLLHLFDRLDRKLDGLAQAIRFADYGASGLFDAVKIREGELERLYELDLSLLSDLSDLSGDLSAVPLPGDGDGRDALELALDHLGLLEEKWSGRKNVISGVVQASS